MASFLCRLGRSIGFSPGDFDGIVFAFCCAVVAGGAARAPDKVGPSPLRVFLYLIAMFAFISLVAAKFLRRELPRVSRVLERGAIFFTITGAFAATAVTIPYLLLRLVILAFYILCVLATFKLVVDAWRREKMRLPTHF